MGQIQEGLTLAIIARSSHRAGAYPPPQGPQLWASCCSRVVDVARRWLACSVIAAGRAPSLPRAAVVRHVRRGALARCCAARCCSRNVCKALVASPALARPASSAARSQDAMSSEDVSRAKELYWKGAELREKGHILRAVEYFGRAAEAARPLDPGPENLVVLAVQAQQVSCLVEYLGATSYTKVVVDQHILAAHRTECITLFSTVISALERRRIAGTLVASNRAADEEARHAMQLLGAIEPFSALSLELSVGVIRLVGYATFLNVASTVLRVLGAPGCYERECSAAQFQSFAQYVVNAIGLMQQPRCISTFALASETLFAKTFPSFLLFIEMAGSKLDKRLQLLLTGAWQRLEQSGVLETRGILDQVRRGISYTDEAKTKASINAALTAPGLRSCVLERCGTREAHPQHFKQCAACRTVVYCCREHQLEDWPTHKAACKQAARKASVTSSDK